MNRLDQLRRVAGRLGIHTRHADALGVEHRPDEAVLSQLVAAFGLPADPAQAEAALNAGTGAAPFGLGAVQIIAAESPDPSIELYVPDATTSIEWRLSFENGHDVAGTDEPMRLDPNRPERAVFPLPGPLPLGYHRLEIAAGGVAAEVALIVAPPACHLPPELQEGARSWGLTTQLYGLRSADNWGMGDFGDLAELAGRAGSAGAAALGVNPLHALFAAEPRHVSPYSPSSRLQLDYLYIDVTAAPGFAEDAAARALVSEAALAAVRRSALADHAAVAGLKRPVLEALHRRFRAQSSSGVLPQSFRRFCDEGGAALRDFALFEALHEHFLEKGGPFSWREWPPALRDPASPEVAAFADAHRDRIEFFCFLQWEADRQLGAAAAAGSKAGLALGLYRDLAVGVDPQGAEAWADQELIAPGAAIGAPPDALSRAGQNWGLAPINPVALRRRGFAPFIAALRANMRHAGILRIDHVMGLRRLYWVPKGSPATGGAYVDYPFADFLRLVALESQRHRCAVIGEDLGTVPEGFRETMAAINVLSYRIFAFERRHDGNFIPPGDYPPLAAASAATHDLATLRGFWLGRDIQWRRNLGLYPDPDAEAAELRDRHRDRWQLLEALEREGLLARARFAEFLPTDGSPVYTAALGEAIHAFLARSRARLMLVQIEDIAGEGEQANLPGTSDAHPNWRRRMSRDVEDLFASGDFARTAELVTAIRQETAVARAR